jgi:hypothetical protein
MMETKTAYNISFALAPLLYFKSLLYFRGQRKALNRMAILALDFYTSHLQFYIRDKSSPFRTDSIEFWTDQASEDRLAIEEGLLGIGTECYGHVKGDLQVLNALPEEQDFSGYDHIVEGSISLTSDILQVHACLDNTPTIELKLPPATYRVRIYSSNLATVDGDDGEDYYQVRIWQDQYLQRRVLKRWTLRPG